MFEQPDLRVKVLLLTGENAALRQRVKDLEDHLVDLRRYDYGQIQYGQGNSKSLFG